MKNFLKFNNYLAFSLMLLQAQVVLADVNVVTPNKVINAFEKTFGITQGERRNHTKGTCAVGEFIGSKDAVVFSRSELFTGKPLPIIARFSLAGGNPSVPDTAKSPRGLALEFLLTDGSLHHMAMLNTPVFGAANPQTFYNMLVAKTPDPLTGKPDQEKIEAFKLNHTDNKAQAHFLANNNPPSNYYESAYYGIHTFKFFNKDNKETLVRWRFVPQSGEKQLSEAELENLPANFLEQNLIKRTEEGAVKWKMLVTIGEPDDVQDNPTIAWPKNREEIEAGTLILTESMHQEGAKCESINFDPLVLSDGIKATNDPILLFRSPSYAISFAKRLSNQ
ncbi:MAG: catalase family peroxidase [Cycloclasticus sp.]|jgi:catalase|uniref:catalase family peroxidase n=1 Tax=Cycloclasticus sp. TaxID=2024830 RepID=UPI00257FA825|nr:catalase family peroxidase [Cycloclasticus sp.]MBV1899433.1 catalase family peroxidase [Cycloclasticus sp.]